MNGTLTLTAPASPEDFAALKRAAIDFQSAFPDSAVVYSIKTSSTPDTRTITILFEVLQ